MIVFYEKTLLEEKKKIKGCILSQGTSHRLTTDLKSKRHVTANPP